MQSQARNPEGDRFSQAVLDALPAQVAVLDRRGVIIAVNEAWRRFALENGGSPGLRVGLGLDYLAICRNAMGEDVEAGPGSRGRCRHGARPQGRSLLPGVPLSRSGSETLVFGQRHPPGGGPGRRRGGPFRRVCPQAGGGPSAPGPGVLSPGGAGERCRGPGRLAGARADPTLERRELLQRHRRGPVGPRPGGPGSGQGPPQGRPGGGRQPDPEGHRDRSAAARFPATTGDASGARTLRGGDCWGDGIGAVVRRRSQGSTAV